MRLPSDTPYTLKEPSSGWEYIKKVKAIKGATFVWRWHFDILWATAWLMVCTATSFGFSQCTDNVFADLLLRGGNLNEPGGSDTEDSILEYVNLFSWSGWGELMLWKFIVDFWYDMIAGNLAIGFLAGLYYLAHSESYSVPFCVPGDLTIFGTDCAEYDYLGFSAQ